MTTPRVMQRGAALLPVLALVLTVGGCTAGDGSTRSSAPASSLPVTAGESSSPPLIPVSTGPTRSVSAASCPFVGQGFVHRTMGMRLGRITVQRSGGKVIGCRFYALQGGPLHRSEHLPGPHQPAVEVTNTGWRTPTDAYNAFVRLAELHANATRADFGSGRVGVCFQNEFDPRDHGQDYACAASSGSTEVVVRSVDTTGTFNTIAVTKKVLDAVSS